MAFVEDYERMCSDIGKSLKGFLRSCPSDVSLLVEGKMLPVHKFVLSARSKYFDTLFSIEGSRAAEDQKDTASGSQSIIELCDALKPQKEIKNVIVPLTNNVIEIRNVKLEVVKGVLDYFYEGHYDCHARVETHFKALELAHQFKLDSLQDILINHLVKSITMENYTDFFNFNSHYQIDKLEKTYNDFLEGNSEEIIKSDILSKLTLVSLLSLLDAEDIGAAEIDIFRAAERWAGVNKPDKGTVEVIVKKIRLETISQKDLFRVVKCSKELPSIDIMDAVQSAVEEDAASKNFRRQQCKLDSSINIVLASRGANVAGSDTGEDFCNPMDCIDGDENSFAIVTENSPLKIKLGYSYWLSSLQVKIDALGNSYTIESSPDGESWQQVGGETEGEEGIVWRNFEFSHRVVLYFRVTMKKLNCYGIDLYHLESPARTTAVTN